MLQFNSICQINKTKLYTFNFAWNILLIVLTSHNLFNPIYFYQFISQWVTVKIGIKFRPRLFRLYLDRV